MQFPHGQTVTRERQKRIPDSYNPDRTVEAGWDDPDRATIGGAFVASSSSNSLRDATRAQVLTAKSLFCMPGADVKVGDRIVVAGYVGYVHVVPAADVNPFTGWQPVQEIPLEEPRG